VDRAPALTVEETVAACGITRLCHLTPFRNLLHLATENAGLLSLRQLAEAGGDYDQQDLERLDNHPDHISCSIEYPNGWYLRQRRLKATPVQKLFPDWTCLVIKPRRLWAPGTRVCVRNAAASGGALVTDISPQALANLYSSPIVGAGGQSFRRSTNRLTACPTDDQAEVLLHREVPIEDIPAVIVTSETDAKRFHAGLRQIGADPDAFRWIVAPALFQTKLLSRAIADGRRPPETPWQ
jgi:ssDNA thymidine ADP-ribosyltransferase, DarT